MVTMNRFGIIWLVCLVRNVDGGTLFRLDGNFTNSGFLDNQACAGLRVLDFGWSVTGVFCAMQCDSTSECHSFVYNRFTRRCRGMVGVYTTVCGETTEYGNRYYVNEAISVGGICKEDVDCVIEHTSCIENICTCDTGYTIEPDYGKFCSLELETSAESEAPTTIEGLQYGEECNIASDECSGNNTECWEGTCVCSPGYSLKPEVLTCNAGCEVYGDTFQIYVNQTLACEESPLLSNITIATCMATCIGDAECRTMRYNNPYEECKVDRCTPFTNPEDLTHWDRVDLYIRNCV